MSNLFEQLADSLGRRIEAPEVQVTLERLGEQPEIIRTDNVMNYGFPLHGILLNFKNGVLDLICFFLATEELGSGWHPFTESLSDGISIGDVRTDLQRKMGPPTFSKRVGGRTERDQLDYWDYFVRSRYRILTICNGTSGQLVYVSLRERKVVPFVSSMFSAIRKIVRKVEPASED